MTREQIKKSLENMIKELSIEVDTDTNEVANFKIVTKNGTNLLKLGFTECGNEDKWILSRQSDASPNEIEDEIVKNK